MHDDEFKELIREIPDNKLRSKLVLGDLIVGLIERTGDARSPSAIRYYRRQQELINQELIRRRRAMRQAQGIPEPEPVVIGMKMVVFDSQVLAPTGKTT